MGNISGWISGQYGSEKGNKRTQYDKYGQFGRAWAWDVLQSPELNPWALYAGLLGPGGMGPRPAAAAGPGPAGPGIAPGGGMGLPGFGTEPGGQSGEGAFGDPSSRGGGQNDPGTGGFSDVSMSLSPTGGGGGANYFLPRGGDTTDLRAIAARLAAEADMARNPNATELAGLGQLDAATNLADLTGAYKNYFGAIAAPHIRNNLIASGQGRSGAQAEATALAGANIGRDLAALSNQRLSEAGKARLDLGSKLFERVLAGLGGSGKFYGDAAGIENQFGISEMNSRRQFMATVMGQLLDMLRPEETRVDTRGEGWNVSGGVSGGYGMGGGGGTGLPTR